jgi:hypothetical protein
MSIEQEGFRFGVDDGSESAHTWKRAKNAHVTHPLASNLLLRVLVDAEGDPDAAALTLRYQKNGSGGYVAVPVGEGVTENIGTTSYNALGAGTSATNTTTHDVNYPSMTGATAKTALYLVMTGRSNTANTEFVPPSGWSNLGTLEGGTGTWGADTGTRRVTIFRKDSVSGTESGTITVTLAGTSNNTIRGSIVRVEPPDQDHTIEETFASGADTTNGTGYSATASSSQTYLAGDLLLVATAQNIDSGTLSSVSLTASGVTFGTPDARASTAISGGNDHRHIIYTADVTSVSGTPNVAATWAYTISANGSGPTAFLRIRARRAAVVHEVYIAPSANITSGGEATTARLTPPAGKTTGDFVEGRRWDDENGTDSLDLTTDAYTEVEWCLSAQSPVADGDYVDLRVYASSSPLDTYTVTPRWTIGTAPPADPVLLVELREGASVRAAWEREPGADWATADLTLTSGERDSITDWSDLRVRLTQSGVQVDVADIEQSAAVTGTGVLIAPPATLAGAGTSAVIGAGTLVAAAATLAGAGTSAVTGTGVLVAAAATWAGAGTSSVTGTGVLTAPAATLTGTGGSSAVTGDGALAAAAATLAGSGTSTVTGTGVVTAAAATIAGAGTATVTGTGAWTAAAATLAGTGTSTVTGIGALTATPATLAGAGTSVVTGTGAWTAAAATLIGGDTGLVSGTGAWTAPAATSAGVGTVTVTGAGTLSAPAATLAGTGAVSVTATGALVAAAATLAGAGTATVTATGTLTAAPATLAGAGTSSVTGTAALTAGVATLAGVGVSSVIGTGAWLAPVATISGREVPAPTYTLLQLGAVAAFGPSLGPVSAFGPRTGTVSRFGPSVGPVTGPL